MTENEEQALETAEIFYRLTENRNFLLLLDSMVTENLKTTALLAYDPDTRELVSGDKICFSKQ